MKKMQLKLFFVAVVLSTTLTGCFGVTAEFRYIRNDILQNIDGKFTKDVEFGVGSVGIALASTIVSFSDADEYIDDLMRQVSRLQVAVYENKNRHSDFKINSGLMKNVSDNMYAKGWEYIVRSVENDKMTMVFIKSDEVDTIENLFVISLDDDELVMTELYGDLGEAINIAIRQNGLNFHMAKN